MQIRHKENHRKLHHNQIAKIKAHFGRKKSLTSKLILGYWIGQLVESMDRWNLLLGSLVGWGQCLCSEVGVGVIILGGLCSQLPPYSSRSLGGLLNWKDCRLGHMDEQGCRMDCGCPFSVVMLPVWMEMEVIIKSWVRLFICFSTWAGW